MNKLFTIGIEVAIVALIVGSLFSSEPMWTDAHAADTTHAALTITK